MAQSTYNDLHNASQEFMREGKYRDALAILLDLADGDRSLDGGYIGYNIGQCYEMMGLLPEAWFRYGRAFEENPTIEVYAAARRDLHNRLEKK